MNKLIALFVLVGLLGAGCGSGGGQTSPTSVTFNQAENEKWWKLAIGEGGMSVSRAAGVIRDAYAKDKSNPYVLNAMGILAANQAGFAISRDNPEQMRFVTQAKEYYDQALGIIPRYPDVYYNLGLLHWRMGELEQASEHFTKAKEINPESHLAIDALSQVRRQMGRYDEDLRENRSMVARRPLHALARMKIITALIHQQDFDSAEQEFDEMRRVSSRDGLTYITGAVLYFHAGEREQALEWLAKGKDRYQAAHFNTLFFDSPDLFKAMYADADFRKIIDEYPSEFDFARMNPR